MIVSRRADFCITGRENGIRGRACRAGTFSLYWRKDGQPIWVNPDLIAAENSKADVKPEDAGKLLVGDGWRIGR